MSYALVVESDAGAARRHVALLRDMGIDATAVRDANDALSAVERQGRPMLIVSNLSLPGMDGFELISRLQASAAPDRIPVVVQSPFMHLRTAASERKAELGILDVLARTSPMEAVRRALERASAATSSIRGTSAARSAERPAAIAPRESSRLARIASLALVDDLPPDEALQDLVQETARTFQVPIALVSIVLEDRQWFKSHVGLSGKLLEERGTEREVSFCAHVVEADRPEPLVVPDAAIHPVFASNRLVREGVVRSYVGAPLVTRDGTVLGTLCILDNQPMAISADQVDMLVALARRIAGDIELRSELRAARAQIEKSSRAAANMSVDALRAIVDHLDVGALLFDAKRTILYANPAMAALAGLPAPTLVGMARDNFLEHCSSRFDDPIDFLRRMRVLPEGPYVATEDLVLVRPHRRVIRWSARPVAFQDGTYGQLGLYRDVTNEVDLAAETARLAVHDPLTGLLNRRGIEDAVPRERERARRDGSPLCIAMIDVDHFKRVNDTWGHDVGDAVIRDVASACSRVLRATDILGRWGGEEFLALIGADEDTARSIIDRARRRVETLDLSLGTLVTISAGVVAMLPDESFADATRRADQCLYQAKHGGRNRVV